MNVRFVKKTFSDSSSFAKHKRIHAGDKTYPCDICEKAFPHINPLTDHKRVHSGEKPYSCIIHMPEIIF